MNKREILIITHGKLGMELLRSAEMIMGPQRDALALALLPGESVDDLRNKTTNLVQKSVRENKEVIVLCDLLGGSPSNVALFLLSQGVKKILTGVNLPMLIELLTFYQSIEDTDELLNKIQVTAKDGIKILDKNFLRKEK